MTAQAYCGLAAAFLFLIVSTSDPRVQFVDATAGPASLSSMKMAPRGRS